MAVAAGSVALPTLLKLAEVLTAQKQDLVIGDQLPVEVELGKVRLVVCLLCAGASWIGASCCSSACLLPSLMPCTVHQVSGRLCIHVSVVRIA